MTLVRNSFANFPSAFSIRHLLLWCSPSNVSRFVMSVIIDAINRPKSTFPWCWPNVSKKGIEIVNPTFIHRYSASAVAMVRRIVQVKTSVFHVQPRFVFFRFPCSSFMNNQRGIKRSFYAPTILQSISQCFALNARNPGPFGHSFSFASMRNPMKRSALFHSLIIPNGRE